MHSWYEKTAEWAVPQIESLSDFPICQGLGLPQLDEDHKSSVEEEFSLQEGGETSYTRGQ
jgi:hypothetical protein